MQRKTRRVKEPDLLTKAQGWGWPGRARKAHFFLQGSPISSCGRWLYTGIREDIDLGDASADKCPTCERAQRLEIARRDRETEERGRRELGLPPKT